MSTQTAATEQAAEPTFDDLDETFKHLLEAAVEEANGEEEEAKDAVYGDALSLAQVAADALTDLRCKPGELSDGPPSDVEDTLENAEGEIDTLVRALEDLADHGSIVS